ncbi:hypothetical protein [Halococcoides cellulosivorans]|uniref:Hpr(Ser) kinase/phosphatase n=1 Tax=Halococcoides cellulosivorans TaxID=1679096 RepID=A0A2R4X310_9EURY|nr:hypothetical protein [Halococcoides cellulosivorans]AWB28177.1 hypothetical protein HARCEL1_10900 [Halococcoides cellulosivorans]
MATRETYRCFDLLFDSPVELPLPTATGDPDVRIETGTVEERVLAAPVDETRGGVRIPDVATLSAHEGRRLVVDRAEGVSAAALAGPILGVGIAALCHQRGRDLLHGSAALIDGGVVVIVGPSGAGKSTLAMQLAAAGGTVLADDVVPVLADRPALIAGPPLVRTTPTAVEATGLTPVERHPLATGDGAIHRLSPDRSGAVLPIDAIVALDDDGGRRSPAAAALTLLGASYTTHLDARPDTVERTVDRWTALAESVPVVSVAGADGDRSAVETRAAVRAVLEEGNVA